MMMFLHLLAATTVAAKVENYVVARMGVETDPATGKNSCVEVYWSRQHPALAMGKYWDRMYETGWDELQVKTVGRSRNSELSAFAAGCVEARLTSRRIYQYWSNYVDNEYASQVPDTVINLLTEQELWVREQLETQRGPFWDALRLVMAQFDGLVSGIQQFGSPSEKELLTASALYLLGAVGDLTTINKMFAEGGGEEFSSPGSSALIYTLRDSNGETSDLFVGHATWRPYYSMLRMWKVYEFHYMPQRVMTFSSSPGLLHSGDDFYVMSQMIVMQTTNNVLNTTLLDWVQDNTNTTVLTWQRAVVANGWSRGGRTWTDLFSQYNSGTANNQWMIVDTSKYEEDERLPFRDLLWIVEQMPGKVVSGDVTDVLKLNGYWPSYNVPYFREVYDGLGYPIDRNGPNGYVGNPRAKIFARRARKITSLEKFQRLMRYNKYRSDSVCEKIAMGNDPSCAISSRMDLAWPPEAFGGIDAKVVSLHEARKEARKGVPLAHAQSGPTHDDLKPFFWTAFPYVARRGVPDFMGDFEWENFPSDVEYPKKTYA